MSGATKHAYGAGYNAGRSRRILAREASNEFVSAVYRTDEELDAWDRGFAAGRRNLKGAA